MPLSKKHYIQFANIICKVNAKEATVDELMRYFKRDNSRFSKSRFTDYIEKRCGRKYR